MTAEKWSFIFKEQTVHKKADIAKRQLSYIWIITICQIFFIILEEGILMYWSHLLVFLLLISGGGKKNLLIMIRNQKNLTGRLKKWNRHYGDKIEESLVVQGLIEYVINEVQTGDWWNAQTAFAKNKQSRLDGAKKSNYKNGGNQHSYCSRKLCNAVFSQANDCSLVIMKR